MLDEINSASDLRLLSYEETGELAAEIRERMIEVISKNGGHLASSLGAVELTIALHRVFSSPGIKSFGMSATRLTPIKC